MSSKVDRAIHGPSWAEVILGAILSLGLGIAIGALLLIVKPVVVAKEVPKDAAPGTVYFVQGSGSGSPQQTTQKLKALVSGQTIKLTEGEINALAAAATAGEQGKGETVAAGTPNVRIRDGVMQLGVPLTVNVLGLEQKIIVQARGGFQKEGDAFAFEPSELYFGSCPVQRLPFLSGYVRTKVMASVPPDLLTAWQKLSNVAVEGNTLALTM